jgi:hypothetical protein
MAGVDKALVFTIVLYAVFAATWLVGYWMPDAETMPAPPSESVIGNQTSSAPILPAESVTIEPENDFIGWVAYITFLVGAGTECVSLLRIFSSVVHVCDLSTTESSRCDYCYGDTQKNGVY